VISIKVDDRQVLDTLNQLVSRAKNLRPAFAEIGEDLLETTKRRFNSATAPNGTPWADNSDVTIARYLGTKTNNFKKDGSLSKRGQANSSAKKPLTGESKSLQRKINYQLIGATGVTVGSPMVYAAMQQFGGTKSQFPHLWGNIPARPFLGISKADRENILDIISSYLEA
jgi:phage virion morphogenesis protein